MLPVEPFDDLLTLVALLDEVIELLPTLLELPVLLVEPDVDPEVETDVEPEVDPTTGGAVPPPGTGPVAGPPSKYCCM